jgi:predicted RNA binding protein YcfA (HicA-like mRNA interferase family)
VVAAAAQQRLPSVTPRQILRALLRAGFIENRTKGSHVDLIHPITRRRTTVAMHPKDLSRALVKEILKQSGLSEEELHELL